MFLLDFPRLKCYCNLQYLTNKQKTGFVECYVFAVTLIESRPLLFTIHTVHGAVYSRIPLQALKTKPVLGEVIEVDPWGSISGSGQVIRHRYLKDYKCVCLKNNNLVGRYWATIDYYDGGFAQDPEQHKTSNIILMELGDIVALPNNEVLFLDSHFVQETDPKELPYRRNTTYYL